MLQYLVAASNDRKPLVQDAERVADTTSKQPPTILVVDDDPANLVLARALLESEGFRVVTATDAISTFGALQDTEPALILMDIQLPGMDGWELTRRLKKNIVTSHIPVIALTAYGKHGDEQRARDAGFVEFVAKPVSTRELPAIIRRHLPR